MTRRRDVDAFQEAWERGVPPDGEIAALVRAAEQVCASAVDGPTPAFRESLRERLMTEAETILVEQPGSSSRPARATTPATRPVRRRLAGLTAAAVASIGSITLVNSSAQALPGEMLYPVKLGVEHVQMTLKDEGAERGTYQLQRATERLREAESLAGDTDDHAKLPGLLDEFTSQAEAGSGALFTAFDASGEEQDIANVTAFAERSTTVLTSLSTRDMPAEYVAAWEKAAGVVTTLADESSRRCADCDRADVDDLVRSVAEQVRNEAAPAPAAPPASSGSRQRSDSSSDSGTPRATSGASSPGASAAPTTAPSPSPSATRKKGLRQVTDPVVGGLLGNDEQEGLIPGLLNGLLGNNR